VKRDWRDSVRTAADLAILGFAVTVASLPLLTAGAAVGTASEAVRHFQAYETWPRLSALSATFRRRLVPGLWAGPVFLAGVALTWLDVLGLRRGVVPGGPVVLSAVLAVAVLALGWAALVAVLGGHPREAYALALSRPPLLFAAAGVVLVALVLALFVHPALVPLLVGFLLHALHAVVGRLAPAGQVAPRRPIRTDR
jgi:hypothetical protein